jgi:peptidoglycan/LPS O-acetylase OafA/YrhL
MKHNGFYRRRSARIYPAQFVDLVAGLFVKDILGSHDSASQIALALTGLPNWVPQRPTILR